MPEDHTPDNHPLKSLLGLPDYVPLSKAAELLGLAPRDLFEHAKKIPIYGKVLQLIIEPLLWGKLLTMEELRELAKSTPANDALSILSGYRQEFLPPKRLDPDVIHTLQSAPQDWALLKTQKNSLPGYGSPSLTTWLLLHSELSVRGDDLQDVLDAAKVPSGVRWDSRVRPPTRPADEPQNTSEKERKVSAPESQDILEGDSSAGRKPEQIRWLGTQQELVLLFHVLKDSNLIQYDQIPWTLVSKLFADKRFKPLKAKSLTDTQHKTLAGSSSENIEDLKQKLRTKLDKA